MAKYRAIYQKIWKDPDFQTYDSSGKLIFIYLCTNSSTTESGIYPITDATISNETGILRATVGKRLNNGLKNVVYDFTNKIVFVRKFRFYNTGGRPELIEKSIVQDFKTTFETPLWNDFLATYPEFHDAILTVGKPLANYDRSVLSKGIGNGNGISKGKGRVEGVQGEIPTLLGTRKGYGEFKNIFLADEDYEKLKVKFGEELQSRIENLSKRIKEKGYKYDDFYLTLIRWAERDAKKGRSNGINQRHSEPPGGLQPTEEEFTRSAEGYRG